MTQIRLGLLITALLLLNASQVDCATATSPTTSSKPQFTTVSIGRANSTTPTTSARLNRTQPAVFRTASSSRPSSLTTRPDSAFQSITTPSGYPQRSTRKPNPEDRDILVCLMIEKAGGDRSVTYDYDRLASGISIGVNYVNQNVLQNGYKIITRHQDIGRICSRKNQAIKRALDLYNSGINCNVYFGPGCGYTADSLYNMAEYMQIPMLSCPGYGFGTQAPRSTYYMATRTSYTTKDTTKVILRFLDMNGFKHVTVICDDAISFYELLTPVFTGVVRARPDLTSTFYFVNIRSSTLDNKAYQNILRSGNQTSRVFLFLAKADVVRNVLILAERMGMTNGQYLYMAIELFDSDSWGQFTWSFGDSGDREAKIAFESLILVSLSQFKNAYFDIFSTNVKRIAKSQFNYTFRAFEDVDPVIGSYYDTVILYANAINQALSSGGNVFDGRSMAARTRNLTFLSPLNGLVKIDEVGDRLSDFALKSMNPKTGKFEVFETYSGLTDQVTMTGKMYWPGDKLPLDVPQCGFRDDNPACFPPPSLSGGILGVAVAVPLFLSLAILGGIIYYIVRSLRNEGLDPNWWRISHQEVQVTVSKSKSASLGSRVASVGEENNNSQKTDGLSTSSMAGRTATFKGNLISTIDVSEKRIRPSPFLVREMNQVRLVTHQNVQRILGVSVDEDGFCMMLCGELCQKGSLMDLLDKDSLKLDWSFKNSLIKDVVMGMAFLQATPIESHGNLTAHNSLVDSRFLLKISDFGLTTFREGKDLATPDESQTERNFDLLLWRAPEFLRQTIPPKGSQVELCHDLLSECDVEWSIGDVYSFGIILQQIIMRTAPFDSPGDLTKPHMAARDNVLEVKKGLQPPFRPHVPTSACSSELYNLMENCWDEYPIERPTFAKIKDGLKKVIGTSGDNIIDHLLKRMEQYSLEMEAQVAEKTQQFQEEKKRSEELLSQLLPKSVAAALTRGQTVDPESYDTVTVYFSDIVGFTTISAAGTPMDVVSMLNNLYTLFDGILAKFDAYKVETIGDAYMVASGIPVRNGNQHASQIALVSLQIKKDLETFKIPHQPNDKLRLRIGNNSGPCVAGIVGVKMPRYCLFGDTVSLAMRMESSGEPMKIQLTVATKEFLEDIGGFTMQERDKLVTFKVLTRPKAPRDLSYFNNFLNVLFIQ